MAAVHGEPSAGYLVAGIMACQLNPLLPPSPPPQVFFLCLLQLLILAIVYIMPAFLPVTGHLAIYGLASLLVAWNAPMPDALLTALLIVFWVVYFGSLAALTVASRWGKSAVIKPVSRTGRGGRPDSVQPSNRVAPSDLVHARGAERTTDGAERVRDGVVGGHELRVPGAAGPADQPLQPRV